MNYKENILIFTKYELQTKPNQTKPEEGFGRLVFVL